MVLEQIVKRALAKYFDTFLINFQRDDLSLKFLKGEGSLRNLELNAELLEDLLAEALPNLSVKRAFVSELSLKIPWKHLKTQPVVVVVDQVTVDIEEPETLTTWKNLLEKLLGTEEKNKKRREKEKKEKEKKTRKLRESGGGMKEARTSSNEVSLSDLDDGSDSGKQGKYGFTEKIIDGITLEVKRISISIKTLGNVKSNSESSTRPPAFHLLLEDLRVFTTDEFWNVGNLKDMRKFNKKRPQIHVFKKIKMTISAFIEPVNYSKIMILSRLKAKLRLIVKKKEMNLVGFQLDAVIKDLLLELDVYKSVKLLQAINGLSSCFTRTDLPRKNYDSFTGPIALKPLVLINVILDQFTIRLLDKGTSVSDGFDLRGKNFKFCKIQPQTSKDYESFMQMRLSDLVFVDLASQRNIIHRSDQAVKPSFEIAFLPETLHPLGDNSSEITEDPIFSMSLINRYPKPPPPTLALELQAHITRFQLDLWRGPLDHFVDLVLHIIPKSPKNSADTVVKPVSVQEDEGVVYINNLSKMMVEINMQIVLPPVSTVTSYTESTSPSLVFELNRVLFTSDPKPDQRPESDQFNFKVRMGHAALCLVKSSQKQPWVSSNNIAIVGIAYPSATKVDANVDIDNFIIELDNTRCDNLLDLLASHLDDQLILILAMLWNMEASTMHLDAKVKAFRVYVSNQLENADVHKNFLLDLAKLDIILDNYPKLSKIGINAKMENIELLSSTIHFQSNALAGTAQREDVQKKLVSVYAPTKSPPFLTVGISSDTPNNTSSIQLDLSRLRTDTDLSPAFGIVGAFVLSDNSKLDAIKESFKRLNVILAQTMQATQSTQASQPKPKSKPLDGTTLDVQLTDVQVSVPVESRNISKMVPLSISRLSAKRSLDNLYDKLAVHCEELGFLSFEKKTAFPLKFSFEMHKERNSLDSDWKTNVNGELARSKLELSEEEFKTFESLVKLQMDIVNKIKGLFGAKEAGAKPSVYLPYRVASRNSYLISQLESVQQNLSMIENHINFPSSTSAEEKMQQVEQQLKQVQLLLSKAKSEQLGIIDSLKRQHGIESPAPSPAKPMESRPTGNRRRSRPLEAPNKSIMESLREQYHASLQNIQ